MTERLKEVRYDIYCKCCEYSNASASTDPCNDCLGQPSNGYSHVPVYFHKVRPLINYLDVDPNVIGYTRDHTKSTNWVEAVPTDAELQKYFEKREDGDYWEKEINNEED